MQVRRTTNPLGLSHAQPFVFAWLIFNASQIGPLYLLIYFELL